MLLKRLEIDGGIKDAALMSLEGVRSAEPNIGPQAASRVIAKANRKSNAGRYPRPKPKQSYPQCTGSLVQRHPDWTARCIIVRNNNKLGCISWLIILALRILCEEH